MKLIDNRPQIGGEWKEKILPIVEGLFEIGIDETDITHRNWDRGYAVACLEDERGEEALKVLDTLVTKLKLGEALIENAKNSKHWPFASMDIPEDAIGIIKARESYPDGTDDPRYNIFEFSIACRLRLEGKERVDYGQVYVRREYMGTDEDEYRYVIGVRTTDMESVEMVLN